MMTITCCEHAAVFHRPFCTECEDHHPRVLEETDD